MKVQAAFCPDPCASSLPWRVLCCSKLASAWLQVQKSARHYTEAARDEVKLLTDVRDNLPPSDAPDTCNCVRLHDCFEHRGPHGLHVCMVFEVSQPRLHSIVIRA